VIVELIALSKKTQNLHTLAIFRSTGSISDKSLLSIANYLPNIKNLVLHTLDITDHGMKEISKHCHKLQVLSLQESVEITNKTLQNLSKGCPELIAINLEKCLQITSQGLRILSNSCSFLDFVVFPTKYKNLELLTVQDRRYAGSSKQFHKRFFHL